MKKYLLICIQLIAFSLWASGQKTVACSLSTANGLPSEHTYSTITDKFGYLWIATDKGVVKYNSYTLRIFNHRYGSPADKKTHHKEPCL